ncbi:hypothetical protein C8J57DRAFT_1235538 [Mycena rebaudengoi]|nr:hypothetical protein C8J57DRAFT_1235538 [Mycena rebaudengoi]
MPVLNARWISFFAVSLAVLITIVGVVGWATFEEGTKNRDKQNSFGVDFNSKDVTNQYSKWPVTDYALAVFLHVDSFDPNKAGTALGFRLEYQPINNLSDPAQEFYVPVVPVRLVLQTVVTNFAAATLMPLQTVSQIMDGDLNWYPFDIFRLNYTITAYSSPVNTTNGTPLPMTMFSDGTIQGFKVDTITKAFSVIIIIVMWGLSGSIFVAAMSTLFRERKPELPLIALSGALLFALPNVRNAQPGIPSVVGTISDMIGYFFNMLLIATRYAVSSPFARGAKLTRSFNLFSLLARLIVMSRRTKSEKQKDSSTETVDQKLPA